MNYGKSQKEKLIFLESFDDLSFSTTIFFFSEHNFPILRDRVLSNFMGELDSFQIVRKMWFELFDGSPERMIEWYEEAWDHKEKPHYENLIIMFLVSFFAELLAGLVTVEIISNREKIIEHIKKIRLKSKEKVKKAINKLAIKYESSLKYLFRIYILKNYINIKYEELKEKSFSYFMQLRKILKNIVIFNKNNEILPAKYQKFEQKYIKNHSLPYIEESYSKFISEELLNILIQKYKINIKKAFEINDRKKFKNYNDIKLLFKNELPEKFEIKPIIFGIPASPGFSYGPIKILRNEEDCKKVKKGDIIVIYELIPEYAHILGDINAIIADSGGMISHAAVVGRGLGIPTVVGTSTATKILNDNSYVIVNAYKGIIHAFVKSE